MKDVLRKKLAVLGAIALGVLAVGTALFLGVMIPQNPAAATFTTFKVNTEADAIDANPGNGTCATAAGNCTLRAAVQEANALAGEDWQTIDLPAGTYTLTIAGSGDAESGDLDILDNLKIHGAGSQSTIIEGNGASRVLEIGQHGGTGLTSAVYVDGLTIRNSGETGFAGFGGGVLVQEGSSLDLYQVLVYDNKANMYGAGISNAGELQLHESTVRDNEISSWSTGGGVTATGGGIFNFPTGSVEISRSTISGNRAVRGGGINNAGGDVLISNSTISGNSVYGAGGGIRNVDSGASYGQLDIRSSTITNNEANRSGSTEPEPRGGGGIYNSSGAGQVSITNTILAGNTNNRDRFSSSSFPYAPDCYSIPSRLTSNRNNLVGVLNAYCNMRDYVWGDTRFDLVGTPESPLNPQLGPLQDNGGFTQTHTLLSGSPAIDSDAGPVECSTDQRGASRPADGNGDGTAVCDIGAFELHPPPQMRISNAKVTEGDSGTKYIKFTVSLSAPSVQMVSVWFETANGTASAPSDYTYVFSHKSFSPGQTTKTISVPVKGDTRREPNETFSVNLSLAGNATITDGVGVGTIVNND
jgi:CSLREA domain-containing protein